MKKYMVFGMAVLFFMSACGGQKQVQMSDEEIEAILSDVVAGEKSIEEAGLRYFNELSSESNNIISPASLYEQIQASDDFFILDIRREADFEKGHIESALNIWWFDVGKRIDELPRERNIVVTCYTGQSAGQVVGVLRVMGYAARSLAGGMNNGWLKADLPVVQ